MTRTNLFVWQLCAVVAAGCASGSDIKPYGAPGSSVRPIGSEAHIYFNGQFEDQKKSGQYIFHFDYDQLNEHDMLDGKYIGGYLSSHGLMPPNCTNGIDILRHGRGENGKAWLVFKCQ
jgi:hypothetical protein